MVKLVGLCTALFVLAVVVVVLTQAQNVVALFSAFTDAPMLAKLAWAVIVLVPLVLLPSAVWLSDTLVRQRKAADALALRLDGVRHGVKELAKSQVDAEAAVHHLARTDPEDAISAVQQRLTEADRAVEVQRARNEITDLQSRVDDIRAQQQGLKERLAPVLEKRRLIEQLFLELDTGQHDIERSLVEIAGADDALALDLRLKNLMEFVKQSHGRCDEIEHAAKTIAGLQEDISELQKRLAPLAAAKDGVVRRVKDLSDARDQLATNIDTLQRTPQGPLAERVQSFADEKKKLDDGVSHLNVQFSKLASLRKDIGGLSANFNRVLDIVSTVPDGDGKAGIDARIAAISTVVETTQMQLEEVERHTAAFGQLKTKLGELQSRLVPLESDEAGVVRLVGQVRETCDKLVAKIGSLEAGDDGSLAERVKSFTDAKRDLETRVSTMTEQFSKLATIRKDIAGLFDKLNSAVNGSSN